LFKSLIEQTSTKPLCQWQTMECSFTSIYLHENEFEIWKIISTTKSKGNYFEHPKKIKTRWWLV